MGLDSVELVMKVEKAFGISIPDRDAEKIGTVGELADWVSDNITFAKDRRCSSQLLFYKLREYFISTFGIPREGFTPGTLLDSIIPRENRPALWQKMSSDLELALPALQRNDVGPDRYERTRILGIIPVFTYSKGSLLQGRAVRDLVDWIFTLNTRKLVNAPSICSRYEVERIIIHITSEQTGIPPHEIELKHSFVNDLGID